jgi:hypothetical protein
MSERLFALLLRLYPARFRREYGEEAVRLVRDRLREERGVLPRVRLWCGMLADLVLSLPREHRRRLRGLATAQRQPAAASGMFLILEDRPPQPGSFVFGTVFAVGALLLFAFLLNRGTGRVWRGANEATLEAGVGSFAGAAKPSTQASATSSPDLVDVAEKHRVIAGVIADVRQYYGHAVETQRLAEALLGHEQAGDYAAIDRGNVFAATLNREILDVTHEDRLIVVFSGNGIAADGTRIGFGGAALHRIDERFGVEIP